MKIPRKITRLKTSDYSRHLRKIGSVQEIQILCERGVVYFSVLEVSRELQFEIEFGAMLGVGDNCGRTIFKSR